MSSPKYIVSHMNVEQGPFDEQQLMAKWSAGEILPIDYVYDEAQKDWVLLSVLFPWAQKSQETRRSAAGIGGSAAGVNAPAAAGATSSSAVTSKVIALEEPVKVVDRAAVPSAPVQPVHVGPPAPTAASSTRVAPTAPTVAVDLADTNPTISALTNTQPLHEMDHDLTHPAIEIAPDTQPIINLASLSKPQTVAPKQVTLVGGQAELELSSLAPGDLELMAKDASLKSAQPHRVQVKAAEPVLVQWRVPNTLVVGQYLEIEIKALDRENNICLHYTDQFILQVKGEATQELPVLTTNGVAKLQMHHTKAEVWNVGLIYRGEKHLQLPPPQTLEWQAGEAVRFVVDGPSEHIAGQPLKVKVQAVDQFGNVAKQFQGNVTLEVKAS